MSLRTCLLNVSSQSICTGLASVGDKIARDRISREMARKCSVRVMNCGDFSFSILTNGGLETIAVHSYCCQRVALSPDKGPQ